MIVTNAAFWIWINVILLHKETTCQDHVTSDVRKCRYFRVNKLLKGRCFDMNLREIPQYLNNGIEVLDVSFNRIKKLDASSFERYRSIAYLLLYDNMIQSVEPGTFSSLTSLEEIDLSNNALQSIPMELFQLPSLRNLYVDSNDLVDLDAELVGLQKPIQAPLEYLNIANCGLKKIPDLGILPYLWHLNASLNPLSEITAQSFAPMCHIRSVDLMKSAMNPCACISVVHYLEKLGLNINDSIYCDSIEETCHLEAFAIDTKDFDQCNLVIRNKKAQSTWLYIAASIVGFLVVFVGILGWFHKRNSASRVKRLRNVRRQICQENGNQDLLKNKSNN